MKDRKKGAYDLSMWGGSNKLYAMVEKSDLIPDDPTRPTCSYKATGTSQGPSLQQ